MTWSVVQSVCGTAAGGPSNAATLGAGVVAGNTLICVGYMGAGSGTITAVPPTTSGTAVIGTWVRSCFASNADAAPVAVQVYAAPITGSGTVTATVTNADASSAYGVTLLYEVAGLSGAAADAAGTVAPGASTASVTVTAGGATTAAHDFVLVALGDGGNSVTYPALAGWTAGATNDPNGVFEAKTWYEDSGAAAGVTPSASWSLSAAHHYVAAIVAWTAAAATTTGSGSDGGAVAESPAVSLAVAAPDRPGVPAFTHVALVILENQSATLDGGAIGDTTNAPYLNGLLASAAYGGSHFYAVAHPSLPNYLALTSGSTQGKTTDFSLSAGYANDVAGAANLFTALTNAGLSWKVYEQSLPTAYTTTTPVGDAGGTDGSGEQLYQEHHNPAVYYSQVNSSASELAKIPADSSGTSGVSGNLTAFRNDCTANALPRFALVVPDMANDGHDPPGNPTPAAAKQAEDAWLSTYIPKITATAQYRAGGLVAIVWDEGNPDGTPDNSGATVGGVTYAGGQVACLLLSPYARAGYSATQVRGFYELLRTITDGLGLAPFGAAAAASPMADAFTPALSTDTAGLAESPSLAVGAVATDGGTAGQAASVAAALAASDGSALADGALVAAAPGGHDGAALADAAILAADPGAADAGSLTDGATLAVAASGADAANVVGAASAAVSVVAGDGATLAEHGSAVNAGDGAGSDGGTAGETAHLSAALATGDSGALTDGAALVVGPIAADGATVGESASVVLVIAASDPFALSEALALTASLAASDTGGLTESGNGTSNAQSASGGDTATLAELASVALAMAATDAATLAESGGSGVTGIPTHTFIAAARTYAFRAAARAYSFVAGSRK